jgi:hypothetical protein
VMIPDEEIDRLRVAVGEAIGLIACGLLADGLRLRFTGEEK